MINVSVIIYDKPEHSIGFTNHKSKREIVPISKIKNDGYEKAPRYMALIYEHHINAPYNREYPDGEVWVNITKSKNKNVKLPILKNGESADV